MGNYEIGYDRSMVIDQSGIIQYSSSGASVSNINNTIEKLLATSIENPMAGRMRFELKGNYPNPFNPSTTIAFSVDKPQIIQLNILDSRGRLVKTLVNTSYESGNHSITWDGTSGNGSRVSSGIYYAWLAGASDVKTLKLVLIK